MMLVGSICLNLVLVLSSHHMQLLLPPGKVQVALLGSRRISPVPWLLSAVCVQIGQRPTVETPAGG